MATSAASIEAKIKAQETKLKQLKAQSSKWRHVNVPLLPRSHASKIRGAKSWWVRPFLPKWSAASGPKISY